MFPICLLEEIASVLVISYQFHFYNTLSVFVPKKSPDTGRTDLFFTFRFYFRVVIKILGTFFYLYHTIWLKLAGPLFLVHLNSKRSISGLQVLIIFLYLMVYIKKMVSIEILFLASFISNNFTFRTFFRSSLKIKTIFHVVK